jgi:hypothetical protein
LGGRKPNLSAISTTANPMGGIKNSLVIVIAIVERRPNCELPGPACIIYSVTLLLRNTIPYLTTSIIPFFRVGAKNNSKIRFFSSSFLVKFYTAVTKKLKIYFFKVYIRKKIDKNLENLAKPFQITNLIGKKKKKNPEHNVLWCKI